MKINVIFYNKYYKHNISYYKMSKEFCIIILLVLLLISFTLYKRELFNLMTPQSPMFYNEPIYTSGADQRFFGTTFTSTDQGKANNLPIPGYDYA